MTKTVFTLFTISVKAREKSCLGSAFPGENLADVGDSQLSDIHLHNGTDGKIHNVFLLQFFDMWCLPTSTLRTWCDFL